MADEYDDLTRDELVNEVIKKVLEDDWIRTTTMDRNELHRHYRSRTNTYGELWWLTNQYMYGTMFRN